MRALWPATLQTFDSLANAQTRSRVMVILNNGVYKNNVSSMKEDGVVCVNAVPCLHENASLSMAIEVALNSVDNYCSNNSLRIVGVYFSNEALYDNWSRFEFIHYFCYKHSKPGHHLFSFECH
ncbi:unnamed protein product [Anisakis simplex]|uniref:MPN domain-containing protein n=1 Tax=Anisakis simplex TaxID=6269 RepID=A0A0M3JLP4_ANISI|nr:unnamed protein product [Anisakis simplex]